MGRILRDGSARISATTLAQERESELRTVTEVLALASRMDAELRALRLEQERVSAALAVEIAEKLVGAELTTRPELVASYVEQALARLPAAHPATLFVHPDDAPLVPALPPGVHVELDAALARGDCVIESKVGRVDARLAVRVARIREALGIVDEEP